MENNNAIIKRESDKTSTSINPNTGLYIKNVHEGDNGFIYSEGIRKFGDLEIVESVTTGTAIAFLNGIRVFNSKKELIVDIVVPKGIHYSRETVRLAVKKELVKMLKSAAAKAGKIYDAETAENLIDEKLKEAYYSESYKATIDWGKSIGIEFTESKPLKRIIKWK